VNKYLHTVASVGFLFKLNYDARNHELKIYIVTFSGVVAACLVYCVSRVLLRMSLAMDVCCVTYSVRLVETCSSVSSVLMRILDH